VHGTNVGASSPGSVVLDIGGSRGAAIIFTGADLDGAELEVRRVGTSWDGTHVGIRPRALAGGGCWAALFGPLCEGHYETRVKDEASSAVLAFRVEGGKVTKADWPGR